MNQLTRLMMWGCIFCLLVISYFQTSAQYADVSQYIFTATSSGLEIVAVDREGNTQLTGDILHQFTFASTSNEADWIIPTEHYINVELEDSQIAIVAENNSSQFALFIYDIATNNLLQKPLPTLMKPIWSPDSSAILLEYTPKYEGQPQSETLLYDINQDVFLPVTNDQNFTERNFIWLPNSYQILFFGLGTPCEDPCRQFSDIYVFNRLTNSTQRITDVRGELDPELFPNLCNMAWSDTHQRAYFSVNCTGGTHNPPHAEYLYSVDLIGNVSLETSIPAIHTNAEVPMFIKGIFPLSNGDILLVNDLMFFNTPSIDTLWSVVRLEQSSTNILMTRQFSYDDPHGIAFVTLSPNGNYVAISGHNQARDASSTLLIINTLTGLIEQEVSDLKAICQISWSTDDLVVFVEDQDMNCFDISEPHQIFQLDIETGSVSEVDTILAGTSFLADVTRHQENACEATIEANHSLNLINAVTVANIENIPQTICLEGTYELTSSNNSSSDGANGLPIITGDITLVGINGGATITRNSAEQFRIAKVDTGGRLVLDGITMSNGNPGSQNGGGIRNLGTLEVINSVITGNQSDSGGGIRNNDNATLIITDSTISNNTSTGNGGGVYSNTGSTTTITDSIFTNNQANTTSGHGGAIFVNSSNFSITGGLLDTNTARNGGAIFFNQSASATVTLSGVTISNNTATNHGGGVYVSTGIVVMDNVTIAGNDADSIGGGIRNGADLTIQNNSSIQDNYGGDSQGGGITNYSTLILHDTELIGNYGDTATFLGGAIYNDGTLIIDEGSLINGTSTTVSTNARHGGGIYADGGTVDISDSQIVNNVANADGGGILIRSGTSLNAASVILDNNTANDDGGGLANEGTFTFANGSISNNHAADRGGGVDSSTATNNFIHYSCIEGNTAANRTGVYSGASNFDATNNWWGSTSGATSSQVNSNVVKTPFVNTNCLDAQALGGGAMAATQSTSTTTTTMATVSAPYETIFDERASWLRSGTWAQEANGGRASTGWVVDATIRNMISTLEMPVFVNLGNNPSPRVRYWQRGTLSDNDAIVLEILPQGATTWTILDQQTNLNSDWTQREIDLSAYRGQAVRLRWRLTTAGDVPAGQSSIDYAIDDLQITSRR